MPVFDCHGDLQGNMKDCWFPPYLNPRWAHLTTVQQQSIDRYINDVFDMAVHTPPHRFNVTSSVPSNWTGTALQALYEVAAGYDTDEAAKLLGNLFCRIGVRRDELWFCFQQRVGDHTSRTYMLR
ncbi:MAG: hypothetical protein M3Y41_17415 [Pseudomonadota bacterium]|nr:hypothetical protein [Pseudomonadota bacterium]